MGQAQRKAPRTAARKLDLLYLRDNTAATTLRPVKAEASCLRSHTDIRWILTSQVAYKFNQVTIARTRVRCILHHLDVAGRDSNSQSRGRRVQKPGVLRLQITDRLRWIFSVVECRHHRQHRILYKEQLEALGPKHLLEGDCVLCVLTGDHTGCRLGHRRSIARRSRRPITGQGQTLQLIKPGIPRRHGRHRHCCRRRLIAQCLNHDLLELVNTGVGFLDHRHCRRDRRRRKAHGQIIYKHPFQCPDKLKLITAELIARHNHITDPNAVQRLQCRRQIHNDPGVRVFRSDLNVRTARAMGLIARPRRTAKGHRPYRIQRQNQAQLRVHLCDHFRLRRQRDPMVHVHHHLLRLHRQAVNAFKGRAEGGSLQTCKIPARVIRIFNQRQAEVQGAQGQTDLVGRAAVDTGKGINIAPADSDQLRLINSRTFSRRINQPHFLITLLDAKTAAHAEETKNIQIQVAGSLDRRAISAVQRELHHTARAVRGHGKIRKSFAVRVIRITESVIHHQVVIRRLVDRDTKIACRGRQTANAFKGHLTRTCLERGPRVRAGLPVRQQSQTELGVGQCQAYAVIKVTAVDSHKGTQIAPAHRKQVSTDIFTLTVPVLGQCHSSRRLLERQVPFQRYKIKNIQHNVSRRPRQLSQAAVGIQSHGRTRTSHHLQLTKAVVEHKVGCPAGPGHAPVDLHGQLIRAYVKTLQAHKAYTPCFRHQRREVPANAAVVFHLTDQRQTKINTLKCKAQRIRSAAIKAGKSVHTGTANCQYTGVDFRGRFYLCRIFRHHTVI